MTFTYLFDPLCGWCYAAAPTIQALHDAKLGNIAMAPVGMFYQPRPMNSMAEHAKKNDLRIQELTQQPFSQAYFDQVLGNEQGVFSSQALTLAIVYLESQQLGLAHRFLQRAQTCRYVDGLDTADANIVADIAADVANTHGLSVTREEILTAITEDAALQQRSEQMVQHAGRLLGQMEHKGVPQLIMTSNGQNYMFSGADLYQGPEGFMQLLNAIKDATNM
ncbi:DsbA family protein [Marinomonas ostreistagni]|uniref:DsbA family protein n=1 Tax=Marinomonas ostreistagni TaxID=359209 RepID=UPI0019525266|nr:DsbA family protein [Marinomonas ostreistagni]MBM6550910.1 DsbA family protein [Marinomonas ostreistagni]